MIDALLPGVVTVEAFDDPPGVRLLPAEEAAVANAVDRRRAKYTTGRHLARQALARLGLPAVAIPSGPRREPLWPVGVVGSVTHCAGYRAVAVARDSTVLALGIDAEPNEPLPDEVLDLFALPGERDHLIELSGAVPGICWDRLLFSGKESVYEAWLPMTHQWLGFEQADIRVDPMAGTFTARLLVPTPVVPGGGGVPTFDGRWRVEQGFVATAIAIPVGS